MDVKSITTDGLFRLFTACPNDTKTFILDVRPQKDFQKAHIMQAYCIRLAANGQALLDYSKNSYDIAWQKDCWWDKPVVIYGNAKLKKDHPVVAFLTADKHAKSIAIYKEGFEAFQKAYPFLCSTSVRNNATKRYPGEIVPGALYLGAWTDAEATDRLDELNVKRVISIHNNPENMKLPSRFRQLRFQLADVDTQDVSQFFNPSYEFIEEARGAGEAVLVHCGAGVSRSAALCIAYLMRRFTWPAHRARAHCQLRRSVVNPNQGFWRSLCAFEEQLGITDRQVSVLSNPADTVDFHGADAPVQLTEGAAGQKVVVKLVSASKAQQDAAQAAAAAKAPAANGHSEPAGGEDAKQRDSGGSAEASGRETQPEGEPEGRDAHDEDRHKEKDRDWRHDRDKERERDRDRHRSRDDRHKHRHRSSSRERRRGERDGDRERGSHYRRGDRERGDRDTDHERDRKRHKGEGSEEPAVDKAADAPKAGVILEVRKDGKAVGGMELSLQSIAEKAVFGRAPACDVPLEHLSISRQHAVLTTDTAGNLFLTDLGSAHGTNLNEVWIRANEARLLNKGAVFKFGASSREYKVLQRPRDSKPAKPS